MRLKLILGEVAKKVSEDEGSLLIFVKKSLVDYRGLLISEIKENSSSDYSLLESFGQLMEYSLLIKNKRLFDVLYRNVKRYFLSKEGYLYWRINRRTLKPDNSTAFLDSFRILYSLVKAFHIFKERDYLEEGRRILEGIIKYNTYKNFFVDFYDGRIQKISTTISLFYLDIDKIQYVAEEFSEIKKYFENSRRLLLEGLKDSDIFFPIKYDLLKNEFIKPRNINTIEQVLIALYIKDRNLFKNFLNFVNMEINKYNKISIQYNWLGRRIREEESSGVYTLVLRLYHKLNERTYLNKLKIFIKRFKGKNMGLGDHYNYNFYAFDQLENLLTFAIVRSEL
ncbi:MAG: hypothetical protein ABDH25_06045 [Dictyoglomaceae bacterium]